MDVDHALGYTDLLCDLTRSRYFSRVNKCLGIHRQHATASASSLTGTSLIRGCECFPLCLGVIAFGVGFPAFCGFLSAFASHCGEGFALCVWVKSAEVVYLPFREN